MTNTAKTTEEKIMILLAEHIGVDEEELSKNDTLQEDLHMSPADITDFIEKLKQAGLDTSEIDLAEITDVDGLVDNIVTQEEFS